MEVTDFKAVAARKGVDLQATLGQSVVEENPSCVILWFDSEQEVQAYLPGASQTSGRSVPNVRLLGAESDWTAYDGQRVEVQPGTAYFVTDVAGMLYPVTFEDARVVRVL